MYLFHFIVLLNPVFNCSKSFVSFSFDKVTAGTCNFVSVILNSNPVGPTIAGLSPSASLSIISTKTQLLDQVKINSTSQLISGIFKLLQKLRKTFSGITTSVSFLPTLFPSYPASPTPTLYVSPVMLVLYLKDSESEERISLGSSL